MTRMKTALMAAWLAFWTTWRGEDCPVPKGLDAKPETPKVTILVGGTP